MIDGDHTIERCARVSQQVFASVFKHLHEQQVIFEGMLLKPNMVTRGIESKQETSHKKIAEYTISVLKRTVAASVPGIFVSESLILPTVPLGWAGRG